MTVNTRSPGRQTRRRSAIGSKHGNPNPPTTAQDYWQPHTGRFEFGRERFRVTAFRKDRPSVILDPLLAQFGWERNGTTARTGTLNFYRPLGHYQGALVAQADQLGIDVSLTGEKGPWFKFLRMAVNNPHETVVAATTEVSLNTISIAQLSQSKESWRFAKDATHPYGWTADQITLAVCQRFGVRTGRIAKGTTHLPTIAAKSSSGYDIILRAWKEERHNSGRRFVVDDDSGAIEVTEVALPRYMLPLGPALSEAVINSFASKNFASAVIVKGKVKNTGLTKAGKPKRGNSSLTVTVQNELSIARYGYVKQTIVAPSDRNTAAGLRDYGLKYLARHSKVTPTVELTHPGIPWVDVGDAILLDIPEIGFHNLVYVSSVQHAVGPGNYTMNITVQYADPWLEDQSSKVSAAKRIRGLKNLKGSRSLSVASRPHPAKAVKHAGRTHG